MYPYTIIEREDQNLVSLKDKLFTFLVRYCDSLNGNLKINYLKILTLFFRQLTGMEGMRTSLFYYWIIYIVSTYIVSF